jgi:hypothetical protein
MKKITIKQTADFIGSTERILYEWKKKNINRYLSARIGSYLLDNREEELKKLKLALDELKSCCNNEKLQPFENFLKAVEKFKKEIK